MIFNPSVRNPLSSCMPKIDLGKMRKLAYGVPSTLHLDTPDSNHVCETLCNRNKLLGAVAIVLP